MPLASYFFTQDHFVLAIWRLPPSRYFKTISSISGKSDISVLIPQINLSSIDILSICALQIHDYALSFHLFSSSSIPFPNIL
jgi:hypothetical protein